MSLREGGGLMRIETFLFAWGIEADNERLRPGTNKLTVLILAIVSLVRSTNISSESVTIN